MRKIKVFLKVLATLFLLVMVWLTYYIATFTLQQHENNNLDYIPENAVFVARIDGRQLIQSALSSIILNEDEEIIALLSETVKEQQAKKGKGKEEKTAKLGIDYPSDVILFTAPSSDHLLLGLLFNLNAPNDFEQNIGEYLSEQQTFAVNGNVGIILSERDQENIVPLSSEHLQKIAKLYVSTTTDFKKEELFSQEDGDFIAESWSKQGMINDSDILNNLSLRFAAADKALTISGEVKLRSIDPSNMSRILKPEGLHISADEISGEINDSLSIFLAGMGIPATNIHGFSMNYFGTDIVEENGFFIVPHFDALFYLNQAFDFNVVLDSLQNGKNGVERLDDTSFKYGGKQFWYDQSNPKTLRISRSKEVNYVTHHSEDMLIVSGNVDALTQLTGEGMMRRIIEIIPMYAASKVFAQKIDSIEFTVVKTNQKLAKVHGVIGFKDDHKALNAIIKLLMNGQFVSID